MKKKKIVKKVTTQVIFINEFFIGKINFKKIFRKDR